MSKIQHIHITIPNTKIYLSIIVFIYSVCNLANISTPTLLMRTTEYAVQSWSIPCLLKPCLLQSPGHQQPCCRNCAKYIGAWFNIKMSSYQYRSSHYKSTVGTPYNTVPYTTGSNIARLGHGSQNSWSKLWIPVVKEILNRFPCVLLSREKCPHKRIHGSFDLSTATPRGTCRHTRVVVTLHWYGTIGIICHCDHQSTA